jgi:Sulfotransferase family
MCGASSILEDGRRKACLWWFRRLAPLADAMYPIRASTPHECVGIHSYTIQTHRNPLEMLRSSLQLNEVLEGVFAYPGDRAERGFREARSLIESMDVIRSFRKAHPEFAGRFIDVDYDELIAVPLEVVRRIYQRLNRHLVAPASERIQRLAGSRSHYKGRHGSPTLAGFGIDEVFESQRLAAWCSQCKVSDTGISSFPQQG